MAYFYLVIPLVIFAVDVYIKQYIEDTKDEGFEKSILGGRILLRKSHNKGAMLNIMENRQKLVAGFSLGMSVCILIGYLYLLSKRGKHLLKIGLSFLVGGAFSNVYDRLVRRYVVDYFSFNIKWEKIRKIVFNLADLFIFAGSFLVILWNTRHKS